VEIVRPQPTIAGRPEHPLHHLNELQPAPDWDLKGWEEEVPPEARECAMEVSKAAIDHLNARKAVLSAFGGAEQDMQRISDIVVGDPVLSASVLRTVNSPFYGLHTPFSSVFRAVLYLGYLEVKNIVWRTCLDDALARSLPADAEMAVDGIWHHSFLVSRVAYALARERGFPDADILATAALLHDIGKIVAVHAMPSAAGSLHKGARYSTEARLRDERRCLHLTHPCLGGEAARQWSLPEEVINAIERHHYPSYHDLITVGGNPIVIGLVHFADLVVHVAASDSLEDVYRPREDWISLFGYGDDLRGLSASSVVERLIQRPHDGGALLAPPRAA